MQLSTLQKSLKEVTREITGLATDATDFIKEEDMDEILTNEKTKSFERKAQPPKELPFVKYIQNKQGTR